MTTTDEEAEQDRIWNLLHERICEIMRQLGDEDPHANGDYFVLDENWGPKHQRIEINNLTLLRPPVVKSLQALLLAYPEWKIVVAVDVRGKENIWPPMGLVIRADSIIDGLQRRYFPDEFRFMRYEGSRPGSAFD